MFNFKKRTNLPSNFGALAIVPRREKKTKKQIWEDSITPIQINLLPQNKRLEERSAQPISFGCANMAVSQEPVSGTLYCKEHKPKQVIVQPINIQEKKKCYQKKIAVCPL